MYNTATIFFLSNLEYIGTSRWMRQRMQKKMNEDYAYSLSCDDEGKARRKEMKRERKEK